MIPKTSRALGESAAAFCGGALALNLVLIAGLLAVLAYNGLGFFWPKRLVLVQLRDGSNVLGELCDEQTVAAEAGKPAIHRIQLKVGNRDVYGADFRWIDAADVVARKTPGDAVVLERLEWGNFYGRLSELRGPGNAVSTGEAAWDALQPLHEAKDRERAAMDRLQRGDIAEVNREMESLQLERLRAERRAAPGPDRDARIAAIDRRIADAQSRFDALSARLSRDREALLRETVVMETAEGTRKAIPVGQIVRAVRPNGMGVVSKSELYASRLAEFLTGQPRESNTEGGIFPAIFGTVMMVFLMSIAVVPLGVLAALYMHEYAKQGALVRLVRIAVNNLAGVPSIVFGVFGLGFFVYVVGGTIDQIFFSESLPTPTFGTGGILWASLTLALLTVPVVIVATEEGLAAVPSGAREGALALGATKFEAIWRVVLPAAAPGVLTGMILAMARAAGEVAPLMIVGMVKLAPALPVDSHFPFVHMERKFMHLGFHIYDVGFQSPNVEATKPLVFATALLLIAVVTAVNLTAIVIRNRLRRKFAGSAV